uniref:Uncharacterized protein n=1 Tax=Melopsittacus undulatus TaxID=13146 RepID=A0A8V5HBF5_MELUD
LATVLVYRNGDPFFPGRRFVLNPRRFLTLETFLNDVTKSIDAPVAVRNLYTPRHGRCVVGLGDLQDGCQYVAAGFERFKKLDSSPAWGCFFHSVFRNGDLLSPPFPLPVSKSPLLQWDSLLATVTEKAALHSGAVCGLCRLDGTWVSGGEELVDGGYYVAVGNEDYKKLPYFELLVPQDPARRTLWNHPNNRNKRHLQRVSGSAGSELCVLPSLLLLHHSSTSSGCVQQSPFPVAMATVPLLAPFPKE